MLGVEWGKVIVYVGVFLVGCVWSGGKWSCVVGNVGVMCIDVVVCGELCMIVNLCWIMLFGGC